jgi:hypothetical protein
MVTLGYQKGRNDLKIPLASAADKKMAIELIKARSALIDKAKETAAAPSAGESGGGG